MIYFKKSYVIALSVLHLILKKLEPTYLAKCQRIFPFMHVGGGKPHFGIVLCIHVDSLHEIDFNPCNDPITKEIYLMSVLACSCD